MIIGFAGLRGALHSIQEDAPDQDPSGDLPLRWQG